ncbi:MAG: beta-ketoacyl synthase N-terminal-like domain-containing protein [Acidobacteriota bacterium]
MSEPVVVTGRGVVSPLGTTRARHLERLYAGEHAFEPQSEWIERRLPIEIAARVEGFDTRARIRNRMLRKLLQPSAAFAVGAAAEALDDAKIASAGQGAAGQGKAELERCGLYVGSVSFELSPDFFAPALRTSFRAGRAHRDAFDMQRFADQGMAVLDPLLIVKGLPNAALSGVAIELGVKGPTVNLANGTVSGAQAIAAAHDAIVDGEIEIALAGGSDSLLEPHHVVEHWVRSGLSRSGQCRPFDGERDGYLPGQGAGFVVLESLTHARRRGATILGSVGHIGESTAVPTGDDPASATTDALRHALEATVDSLSAEPMQEEAIQAIFAQGAATRDDDAREARVCGERLAETPITATTGAHGYLGAASGPFQVIHALEALQRNELPPTVGCPFPDPTLGIDVTTRTRAGSFENLLILTSDAGRKNVAMIVSSAVERA